MDYREEIRGRVERILFTEFKSNYTVALVKVPERLDPVTIVGNIPNPIEGAVIRIHGCWVKHPKYGMQFKVVSFDYLTPATTEEIKDFLSTITSIGASTASKIVRQFGEQSIDVIENRMHLLSNVPGMGPKRVAAVRKSWAELKAKIGGTKS